MSPKVGVESAQRSRIINAALECIQRDGLTGTTLESVAREAGCSKGIITYWFGNKDQLVLSAFKSFIGYYKRRTNASLTPDMTAPEILRIVINEALPPDWDADVEGQDDSIEVSDDVPPERLRIPPIKKGRLFLGFLPKHVSDPAFQSVFREVYRSDWEGIAQVFGAMGGAVGEGAPDPGGMAWGLLCLFVGASVFRVAGFSVEGIVDTDIIRGYAGVGEGLGDGRKA